MTLTAAQIDTFYVNALARDPTAAELATWVALSQTESTADIQQQIATLPSDAPNFVDPVIRLYQGAFNRVPDATPGSLTSGFAVNVNYLRNGGSLINLAESFVSSAEFHAIYGSTTVTAALITAYYNNILGRNPSAAEVSAWVNSGLDAAHILVGFTQSAEFIADSQASANQFLINLENGIAQHGPLPPPPPNFTLTSDADASGVNEGSSVTFILQG